MESSEELEWELYDIFISGIFDFPIYEHNSARRIVRYLMMRGVLDEEIANAIEGPTVDLHIWLNREGKHLVGEWVIAWLNDCRDEYRIRRRRPKTRNRSRQMDRSFVCGDTENQDPDEDPYSYQDYLSTSDLHRGSLSCDSDDSRYTKDNDSDISSDFDFTDQEEGIESDDGDREQTFSPVGAASREVHGPEVIKLRVHEQPATSMPHYKLNRPRTLTFDPDYMMPFLSAPSGSCVPDAPDSGHVSDTPCSCALQSLHSSSPAGNEEFGGDREAEGSPEVISDDVISLPAFCPSCSCTLAHYVKIFDGGRSVCFDCQTDSQQFFEKKCSEMRYHKSVTI